MERSRLMMNMSSTSGLTERRCMRLVLKRIDDNMKISSSPLAQKKEDGKRKREDSETGGEDEGVLEMKDSLMSLQRRLCPDRLEVTLERMRFKEILVSTPKKGERQVHYFSVASDSEEDDENDDKGQDSRTVGRDKIKYEDWRLQTIQAFPSCSSLGKSKNNDETDNTSNSFFMEVPFYYDFVFSVGYAKDDLHTVLEILDGGKMSTNIIDGYLMLRLEKYYKDFYDQLNRKLAKEASKRRSAEYSLRTSAGSQSKHVQNELITKPTNFRYLSVNFMPVKDRDQPVSTFIPNRKCLPDLSKLGNDSDAQLIAPLYASHHLYLAVFNFQEKRVYVYDSSWHYLPQPLREGQIQAVLQAICPRDDDLISSKWQINFVETSCPQYDEYSCGIFTIHYAENVLRGVAHHKNRWQLSKRRVMQIRRHIAKELLSTTLTGRRFLQAISD